MSGWERLKIGGAAASVVAALFVIRGITEMVFPATGFAALAYKVPGVNEPAVDLAALQRTWPEGLSESGGRTKVRDYMSNIEKVAVPVSAEAPAALAPPPPPVDLGTALAAADPAKGRQTANVCGACHTFDQGGPDHTGPNLWGIVGRGVASHKSFTYSSAFSAQTGVWTYERLDHYLTNPAKAIPGNKMPFAGLRKPEDRANVIAFLSTLSASPVPFPKPQKATATAGAGEQGLASNAKSAPKAADQQKRQVPAG